MKEILNIQKKWQVIIIACTGISMVAAVVGWAMVSHEDETPTRTAQSSVDTPDERKTEISLDEAIGGDATSVGGTISEITGSSYAITDPKEESGYAIASASGITTSDFSSPAIASASGITTSDFSSPAEQAGELAYPEPVQGQLYVWQDGDREMRAYLQTDLTVDAEGAVVASADPAPGSGDTGATGLPVFRSQSGALMALPGGVLICLNHEWSEARIETFFTDNSVEMSVVSPIEYLDNCFTVETDPGFASLDLADALAGQDGVEIASPNWWTEAAPA